MSKFVEVARKNEIPDQSAKCVEVEDNTIALFNLGGEFYAIDNTCTHKGGPLCEGDVIGQEVECPWHGATFNIKSGEVTMEPAEENVATYNVRVQGEVIEIEI